MKNTFQNREDIFECRRGGISSTEIIRGIVVLESRELILLNKLTDGFCFDGYILLRISDITEYRFYDDAECFEKRAQRKLRLRGTPPPESPDMTSMRTVLSSLWKAGLLFSFEKERSYKDILWLGKLQRLTSKSLFFEELDAEAVWQPVSQHRIHAVTKIEWGTRYIDMYGRLC